MDLPILVFAETKHGRQLVARLASIKDFPPFIIAYNANATWKMDERGKVDKQPSNVNDQT